MDLNVKFGSLANDITGQNLPKTESPVQRRMEEMDHKCCSHCRTRDNIPGVLFGQSRQRTEPLLKGASFQMKVAAAFHFEIKAQSLTTAERRRIQSA